MTAGHEAVFAHEVSGSGPCVLVPRCNFAWDHFGLEELERHFTVVVVDPRGYGRGQRRAGPDAYSTDMLAGDLLQACSDAGFERFSVFGYSFTGAVATWLAQVSDRVDAVVAGGFPLLADYGRVLDWVERSIADLDRDPGSGGSVDRDFDLPAALSFYRQIASLPPAALVDASPCPLFSFWGGEDEVLEEIVGLGDQRAGFVQRGLPYRVIDGLGHGGMLERLDLVLPDVAEWLEGAVADR
jgi:pimeloyl-ACP methyl ester carboxylesterase